MNGQIQIRRVYEPAAAADGLRVLCTKRWPRGVKKSAVDAWKPELGTPAELLEPWLAGRLGPEEFHAAMRVVLSSAEATRTLAELAALVRDGQTVTLLTSVKEMSKTHLTVVREVLQERCDSTSAMRI